LALGVFDRLVVGDSEVDLCAEHSGKDVDLCIRTIRLNMIDIRDGDKGLKTSQKELLPTRGDRMLAGNMPDWLSLHVAPLSGMIAPARCVWAPPWSKSHSPSYV
jgi:hypothetical protein